MTVLSVYAPTLDTDDNIKEEFYRTLSDIISTIPATDKILLLGDFNARVGKNHRLWNKVIGKEGIGNMNENGQLLLGLCTEHQLAITNTFFRMKNRFKTSWMHPRSRHWHLIDYVITRQSDLKDHLTTRAMLSADDCWTDHRLVTSKLKIQLSRKPSYRQCTSPARNLFAIERLSDPET